MLSDCWFGKEANGAVNCSCAPKRPYFNYLELKKEVNVYVLTVFSSHGHSIVYVLAPLFFSSVSHRWDTATSPLWENVFLILD